MQAYYETPNLALYQGDCRQLLPALPAQSVHCCVTSPPYWHLRNYGYTGQIGLEPTVDAYVETMVEVFRAVRRVLRDDGTCWVNLGDSYYGDSPTRTRSSEAFSATWDPSQTRSRGGLRRSAAKADGLKPKDLCGIPWRVAFALQADGWYLRADIIWAKSNPMPESCRDRPTKSHEYLFLLAKQPRYFYDQEAVKELAVGKNHHDLTGQGYHAPGQPPHGGNRQAPHVATATRTRRSVWTIATQPYKGAHFATFPQRLVEPCLLAGTSAAGCCAQCGAPRTRVVQRTGTDTMAHTRPKHRQSAKSTLSHSHSGHGGWAEVGSHTTTSGWRRTCAHDAPVEPCTILDPFAGAATTLLVAQTHGRRSIGLEASKEYCALATARLQKGR